MRQRTMELVQIAVVAGMALFPTVAFGQVTGSGKGWLLPDDTPAKNVYVGFGASVVGSNSPDSNQDGSVTGVKKDGTGPGNRLFFGYLFNEHAAVEGSRSSFGQTDFKGTSSGGDSWSPGPVRATNDVSAWEWGAWGRWPIAPRWYAIGYLGVSFWKSKETFTEGTFVSGDTETGSNVVYAAGFEWDDGLKDRFIYRFDVGQRHVDDSSYRINTVSASIVYRFP